MRVHIRSLIVLFIVTTLSTALFSLSLGTLPAFAWEGCTADPAAGDWLAAGDAAYGDGDYAAAFEHYSCAIDADPTDHQAFIKRAQVALLLGRYTNATHDIAVVSLRMSEAGDAWSDITDFLIAEMTADVEGERLLLFRSFAYYMQADPRAHEDFAAMLEADAADVYALLFQSMLSANENGSLENINLNLAKVTELAGETPDVFALIGATIIRLADYGISQEEYDIAMDAFTLALSYDPDHAFTYRWRAQAYVLVENWQAAIDDATRAIELGYGRFLNTAYIERGFAYFQAGRHAEALADYTTALELQPTSNQALHERAWVYDALGDAPAAAADMVAYIHSFTEVIEGAALVPGEITPLEIDGGQVLHLPFEANAGDVLTLHTQGVINSTSSVEELLMILVAPDGTPLVAEDNSENDTITARVEDFAAPQSGTYTLMVALCNCDVTGTVEVLVEVANAPVGTLPAEPSSGSGA